MKIKVEERTRELVTALQSKSDVFREFLRVKSICLVLYPGELNCYTGSCFMQSLLQSILFITNVTTLSFRQSMRQCIEFWHWYYLQIWFELRCCPVSSPANGCGLSSSIHSSYRNEAGIRIYTRNVVEPRKAYIDLDTGATFMQPNIDTPCKGNASYYCCVNPYRVNSTNHLGAIIALSLT